MKTRMHLCPDCGHIVSQIIMYGQLSYECTVCNSYAPWKHRKTIRHPDAPPKRKGSRMPIHTIDHPTISFSSTNPKQVKHYGTVLAHVTLEDIKQNKVQGRHVLLRDMMFAGESPISGIYFGVLEKYQKEYNNRINQYKGTSLFTLRTAECRQAARDYILKEYGWVMD